MQRTQQLFAKVRTLRVFVVGDIILDHYIWGNATRISPEAPVPVVDIDRDTWTAGGAANVALNIRSLGARCQLTGFVGQDSDGRKLARLLDERGIDLIPTSAKGQTIVKTRVLVQHQQLCRLDREAAPDQYAVSAAQIRLLVAKRIAETDAIIISDYAKGIVSDDVVAALTSMARKQGILIALDPKPRRKLKFRGLDLITPNKREALELAGIEPRPNAPFPAEEVCAKLHQLYATRFLVITLGEDGMLLSQNGKVVNQIPTAAREVYDVSGAGDTALAALVLALAAGARLESAAKFANAAAGVVVGKLGTATVTPAEILAHLQE